MLFVEYIFLRTHRLSLQKIFLLFWNIFLLVKFSPFYALWIIYSSSSSQFFFHKNLLFYTYIYTWASCPSLLFFFSLALTQKKFFFVSHFSQNSHKLTLLMTNWGFTSQNCTYNGPITSHWRSSIRKFDASQIWEREKPFTQTEREKFQLKLLSRPVLTSTNYDRMIVCYCIFFSFPSHTG